MGMIANGVHHKHAAMLARVQRLIIALALSLSVLFNATSLSYGDLPDKALAPHDKSAHERDITCLFDDEAFNERVKRKLPMLFHIAEQQASRAGKVGMEVGVLREQILISMLLYKFGRSAVSVNTPPNFPEADVSLFGKPVSIKTVTARSKSVPAIKLIWTVDWIKVESFVKEYEPRSDLLIAIIRWGDKGGLFAIPVSAQREVLQLLGRERYLRMPPKGTNPRGVELSREALEMLLCHKLTRHLEIGWERPSRHDDLEPYIKWLAYWAED